MGHELPPEGAVGIKDADQGRIFRIPEDRLGGSEMGWEGLGGGQPYPSPSGCLQAAQYVLDLLAGGHNVSGRRGSLIVLRQPADHFRSQLSNYRRILHPRGASRNLVNPALPYALVLGGRMVGLDLVVDPNDPALPVLLVG